MICGQVLWDGRSDMGKTVSWLNRSTVTSPIYRFVVPFRCTVSLYSLALRIRCCSLPCRFVFTVSFFALLISSFLLFGCTLTSLLFGFLRFRILPFRYRFASFRFLSFPFFSVSMPFLFNRFVFTSSSLFRFSTNLFVSFSFFQRFSLYRFRFSAFLLCVIFIFHRF